MSEEQNLNFEKEISVPNDFSPPQESKLQPGENPFVKKEESTTDIPERPFIQDTVEEPEEESPKKRKKKKPLRKDYDGADFSFYNIAEDFEKHIALSIPGYDTLHSLVVQLSRYFVTPHTQVIDIGASTGELLANMKENLSGISNVEYIAVEPERKFSESIDAYNLMRLAQDFNKIDLKYFNSVSFITMLFTMQFIPFPKRMLLLRKIHSLLPPEGSLIIAEKTYADSGQLQHILDMAYYSFKAQAFDMNQIVGKARVLETIMRPITERYLVQMLHNAGFLSVTPIWRNLNFGAWICQR